MSGPRLTAVPGELTAEDRRWQERADGLGDDPLREVRTIAGRWSATLGVFAGLFGLVALVSGPRTVDGLEPVWRVATGVLVLLVLLCAGAACWLAAAAAHGRVVSSWRTGPSYRAAYQLEEGRATAQLHWSKIFTAGAGTLLVAAIGVSWYAPRTPDKVLVVRQGATVQCLPLPATGTIVLLGGASAVIQERCP
jgi:hypothetical protein